MEHEKKGGESAGTETDSIAKIKKAAGWFSVLLGTVLAVYAGIWKMLIKPLAGLYLAYRAGQLTVFYVVISLIKCWLSLTVTGFIWSIGYMIKCMLD